ncbi:unnamed protein product [Musa textilis]
MNEIAEAYLDSTIKNAQATRCCHDTHLGGEGFGNRLCSTILSGNSTENPRGRHRHLPATNRSSSFIQVYEGERAGTRDNKILWLN